MRRTGSLVIAGVCLLLAGQSGFGEPRCGGKAVLRIATFTVADAAKQDDVLKVADAASKEYLTFVNAKGLAPIPAGPPATPGK